MAFYLNMKTLLDTFETELFVIEESSGGEWINGQWVENTDTNRKELHEPFIPNDKEGFYSIVGNLRDIGKNEKYNAIWYSQYDYPLGTIVEHKNIRYRVADKYDYTSYSNVTQYFLESEEGNDGNDL